LPAGDLEPVGDGIGRMTHRLPQGQGQARGGVGNVLAQHERGVGLFDLAQGSDAHRRALQNVQDGANAGIFAVVHADMKMFFPHQLPQGEIVFQAGPGRADADDALGFFQQLGEIIGRALGGQRRLVAQQRLPDALLAIDEVVAETPAIAEEIAVDLAVIAVDDAPQDALALAGTGVATQAAMDADGRRGLQIPFAHVVAAEGFVGEYAGGTDLHQVAAEFVLQDAVLASPEIDMVMRGEDLEIVAAAIILVETHATIAGDAAVHLVVDERPQVLVAVGALLAPVAAESVAAHFRHVLQMAFAAFLAHRAIVGMVGHQQFDDARAEIAGLGVLQRDAHPWDDGRHAGHDQTPALVFRVLVLDRRALAAGADRTQGGVPTEIRQIQPQGQTGFEQVLAGRRRVEATVDFDFSHVRSRPY
jgi:hypothetical protein